MPKFTNETGYKPNPMRYTIKLEVEIILDGVPGAFNQVEDHIKHMFDNPYFVSVTVPDEHAHRVPRGWEFAG